MENLTLEGRIQKFRVILRCGARGRLSRFIGKVARVSTGIYSRGTETTHQTISIPAPAPAPAGLAPVKR